MNSDGDARNTSAPRLRDVALAAIAGTCTRGADARPEPEDLILEKLARAVVSDVRPIGPTLDEALQNPIEDDAPFIALARELNLRPVEILAVALAAAVEEDPLAGRILAHVQSPVGGSRPTLGLMCHAFESAFEIEGSALATLMNGEALKTGLLAVMNDTAPLPERPVMLPAALCIALGGYDGTWSGATIGGDEAAAVPLPESVRAEARMHATALAKEPNRALVLRSGSPAESRAVAAQIAAELRLRPLFITTDKLAGLGPWLLLRRLLPVFCLELTPGERRALPAIPGYRGPVLAACGPDGAIETTHGAPANWSLPVPREPERRSLWLEVLGDEALASRLAREHRHGVGRIAHLGRLARHQAAIAGHETTGLADVIAAAWTGEGSGLDALAEPLRALVPDEALVATPELMKALENLMMRCLARDDLVEGLGASATTRYRPGVRALFTGPSGTGKTLAAGWIATRLGLPLYRVDLASVTSKYIGETEKNLSQLLARAEQAEVILLFDEADSLFGKRTDISDSNDRFANAQTNYLLQRIESYDGIVLLTSNSQARFDAAFARRLDYVIEFPAPGPAERRAIWKSHLGDHTAIDQTELNRLAALVDVTGGHIRNAVLTAAVRARHEQRPIAFADIVEGVETELRKVGRQSPLALKPAAFA